MNTYLAPDVLSQLEYTWSQVDGPAAMSFSDPQAAAPTVTLTDVGTYRFQLVVSDAVALSAPSTEVSWKISSFTSGRGRYQFESQPACRSR